MSDTRTVRITINGGVHEAEVDVTFLGQPDQLRRALAQKDLDMTYAIDKNAWVVRSKSTE